MTCPNCKYNYSRRSRRRTLADYFWGLSGVAPWRCGACEARFHARPVALRYAMYARCGICSNTELQIISPQYIRGLFSVMAQILGFTALRCNPCRHKFFSMRPVLKTAPTEETEAA